MLRLIREGFFETSDRLTTHDNPVHIKHGVLHYAVANMPGAVPRTFTIALTNVTVPYALQIAGKGVQAAGLSSTSLRKGINVMGGHITYEAVAAAHGLEFIDASALL